LRMTTITTTRAIASRMTSKTITTRIQTMSLLRASCSF
jgi:hypothetical protein